MKEIKLWEIEKSENGEPIIQSMKKIEQTKTEHELEDILVTYPSLLFEDLKLVGRQTETPGGPLDLLGVDADGNLIVFELKRGTLTRDAVAQLIDYTSFLDELEPEELSNHISERSGQLGIEKIDDFLSWYQEQFAKSYGPSQKTKMALVGLGADERTRRMVSFLADSDLDISLITFYGFTKEGKTLLAKQIEVEGRIEPTSPGGTKKEKLALLQKRVEEIGVSKFYYNMAKYFREKLAAYEMPNQGGFSYYLQELTESGSESSRVYISLYVYDHHPGKVEIRIHPKAVKAYGKTFEDIEKMLGVDFKNRADEGVELWIDSYEKWQSLISSFDDICKHMKRGWEIFREERVIQEHKSAEESLNVTENEIE